MVDARLTAQMHAHQHGEDPAEISGWTVALLSLVLVLNAGSSSLKASSSTPTATRRR